MNQGKLDMVKQEMARVNIDILQCPVVDVSGCESKVWCCKEHYCIGYWNFRVMNQGKLDMVRQEMTRVNIDILGISELKWMGMGEFNSDDHYIYYGGKESLRRNGVAFMVNKNVQNAVLGYLKNAISKMIEWSWFVLKAKPLNTTVIQIYAPNANAKKVEVKLNSSMKTSKTF